ncbi:MAG: hypothetical protein JOZ80_11210 [Acidobacteriaceae bacterium]|nr:hypothetical protein [Acidobacteriaceae bacterium]
MTSLEWRIAEPWLTMVMLPLQSAKTAHAVEEVLMHWHFQVSISHGISESMLADNTKSEFRAMNMQGK